MLIFSRYTWWLGAMVGLALVVTAASQIGVLNPVQGAFLTVASPFQTGLNAVFRPIATLLSNAGELNDLQDENRKLRIENERLLNQLSGARQAEERVKELEAQLNLSGTLKDQTRLAANVVHRTSTPFQDELSIDRGSNDGVRVGMVVVSANGTLMGSVIKVTGGQAFVRLITDAKSAVNGETVETRSTGSVKGSANHQVVFDFAEPDVKVGDIIQTSAISGRFPAGIPIGRVTEVKGTAQDLSPAIKLEPLVRLSTATTVQVITSFLPQSTGVAP